MILVYAIIKRMTLFDVIVLGLIQGLTEFIPVSSSGHLVIAQTLLGMEPQHLFLEAINFGTFFALLVYFWPKIITILHDIFFKKNYKLFRNILITSVPAGLVGYIFADFIGASAFFGNIWVVVTTLFAIGIAMVWLERIPRLSDIANGEELSSKRALSIGFAQMLALVPGVSRSGSTIIVGRLMGLSAKEAAEYSFLASLPIMLGVILKVSLDNPSYLIENMSLLLVGNLVAFFSGLLAVGFLIKFLSKHPLRLLGWYRIVLAVLIAIGLLVQ